MYDFRRPTTLAREHSRVLEMRFETFSRQWGTQLTAKVRARSQVTFDGVSILTYDEYASGLPPQTTMVMLGIDQVPAKAVVQFPAKAALGWFTRMLGGQPDGREEERKFTLVELALARKLMADTVDDLQYSFGTLLNRDITVDGVNHNSQFAQAAATADQMIIARFTVSVADDTAAATIALPADVILSQLGDANPVTSVTDARALVESQLAAVPVTVSLRLNDLSVTPRQVLGLAVGDTLRFHHDSGTPLNVVVDGRPLATASVGMTGSRLAGVIVATKE